MALSNSGSQRTCRGVLRRRRPARCRRSLACHLACLGQHLQPRGRQCKSSEKPRHFNMYSPTSGITPLAAKGNTNLSGILHGCGVPAQRAQLVAETNSTAHAPKDQ